MSAAGIDCETKNVAKSRHIDDGNDQAQNQSRQFVSQPEQPEEERNGGQLDTNAGQEQRARPVGLTTFNQQVARNQRQSRDGHCDEVGQLGRLRLCALPDQRDGQQSAKFQEPETKPWIGNGQTCNSGCASENHQRRQAATCRIGECCQNQSDCGHSAGCKQERRHGK